MTDGAIKIIQTTTEIEIPREDERLVEIVVGLLARQASPSQLGVRVGPSQHVTSYVERPDSASDVVVEVEPESPPLTVKANTRPIRRRNGGGNTKRADES